MVFLDPQMDFSAGPLRAISSGPEQTLIARFISPIRLGRSRPRNVAAKKAVSFTYRILSFAINFTKNP